MHTHRVKLLDDLDHVRRITAKPVQLGDQDNVAFLDVYLQGLKAGPVSGAAGRFVGEYQRWFYPRCF